MKNLPPPTNPPVTQSLKLNQIEIADLQARAATDDKTIGEYAEAFTDGAKFPPVTVFHDGKNYFLADGFHRYFGAKKAGLVDVLAEVRSGTRKDALWFAAGANKTHGLKRSNEDKRHAVELALREKPELADNAIATHVGVSWDLVKTVRSQIVAEDTKTQKPAKVHVPVPEGEKRVGLDGKKYPAPPAKPVHVPVPEGAPKPSNIIPLPIKSAPPEKTVAIPIKSEPVPTPQKHKELEAVLDKTDYPIPPSLIPLWERGDEVREGLALFSAWKSKLRRAQEDKDPLYVQVNFSSALSQLEQFWFDLKSALPFAVCPTCQGKSNNCRLCKGSGLLGEHRWNTVVPKETKEIRKKAQQK